MRVIKLVNEAQVDFWLLDEVRVKETEHRAQIAVSAETSHGARRGSGDQGWLACEASGAVWA